mmetsp:Transcript_44160/g.99539  ORF Transcript_44160/g.99539 Transcript_44160/m.99539 type:complete len:83 (-) Transcript_44160:760-1008(-)
MCPQGVLGPWGLEAHTGNCHVPLLLTLQAPLGGSPLPLSAAAFAAWLLTARAGVAAMAARVLRVPGRLSVLRRLGCVARLEA